MANKVYVAYARAEPEKAIKWNIRKYGIKIETTLSKSQTPEENLPRIFFRPAIEYDGYYIFALSKKECKNLFNGIFEGDNIITEHEFMGEAN